MCGARTFLHISVAKPMYCRCTISIRGVTTNQFKLDVGTASHKTIIPDSVDSHRFVSYRITVYYNTVKGLPPLLCRWNVLAINTFFYRSNTFFFLVYSITIPCRRGEEDWRKLALLVRRRFSMDLKCALTARPHSLKILD